MRGNRGGFVLALVLSTLVIAPMAAAKDHMFVGVNKCRSCHKKELIGDQYAKWQKGPHAKAFTTLKEEKAIKIAKEKGLPNPPSESPECLKCHVTAHDVPAARIKYPMKASDGVQCESCHGPGNDYRKKTTMSDEKKAIAAGLWTPGKDAKICTDCHNDQSPSWNPKAFKLANGTTVGFDYDQAKEKIAHKIPKDVKGHYLELVKKKKASGGAAEEEEDDEE